MRDSTPRLVLTRIFFRIASRKSWCFAIDSDRSGIAGVVGVVGVIGVRGVEGVRGETGLMGVTGVIGGVMANLSSAAILTATTWASFLSVYSRSMRLTCDSPS